MSREHTAEHLFAGSLQRIKGSLKVKKVEFSGGSGSVFIEADSLSFDELAQAQAMANRVIAEGREVKEHFFSSLEEARKAFPSLRAHEERIQGRVRIVEVEGFDYSACAGEHVKNTGECGMILVTRISRSGREYQIDFVVGERALEDAIRMSTLCLSISSTLGSPLKNLERTVTNMKMENEDLRRRLSAITQKLIEGIPLEDIVNNLRLHVGFFKGIDVRMAMRTVGELIEQGNSVYIIGIESFEACNVIVGSGDKRINAESLIKDVSKMFNGKGGGDSRIAVGSFPTDSYVKAIEEMKNRIHNLLNN